MHAMLTACALAALVLPCTLHGSQDFIDSNPALGLYQDTIKCFPATGDFYLFYRNYEYDPFYGGTAKCVYATQHDPVDNDATLLANIFGDTKALARMTFISDTGYSVKNSVNLKYIEGSEGEFNLTAAYLDCSNCHILRSDYINGGAGCQLWIPKEALNEENPCCHFVFDLLCGTSPKYQIYEDCE